MASSGDDDTKLNTCPIKSKWENMGQLQTHKTPNDPLFSYCLVCPLWITVEAWQSNMAARGC